jgi:hypothetical protein
VSAAPPPLDPRTPQELVAALLARLPAFAPELDGLGAGPGRALLEVYARYLHALAQRLGEAPRKNELAFLDMLGVDVLPAQAARAPVVFSGPSRTVDATAPAGTRVAAEVRGRAEPIVFETERAVALASARLAEVVTVWPGRDAYADHSADALVGRPFTLFAPLRSVPHELLLGHSGQLALAGAATVELGLDLAAPASDPLALAWEYWDGEGWRELRADDGTAGLTRRGTIVLTAECAEAKPREVRGRRSHWVRGRLAEPLPAGGAGRLPDVDRIEIRTVIARPSVEGECDPDFLPELATTAGQLLDLTKAFQPLGPAPGPGAALHLSCEEAFSKPGARVTICLRPEPTPQEQADAEAHAFGVDVNAARAELAGMRSAATALRGSLQGIVAGPLAADPTPMLGAAQVAAVAAAFAAARSSADLVARLPGLSAAGQGLGGVDGDAKELLHSARVGLGIARALEHLSGSASLATQVDLLADAIAQLQQRIDAGQPSTASRRKAVRDGWDLVAQAIADLPAHALSAAGSVLAAAQARFDERGTRIDAARASLQTAITAAHELEARLAAFTLDQTAAILLDDRGGLDDPELAWEWWDGAGWRTLEVTESAPGAKALTAHGTVGFEVPEGWERSRIGADDGRWLRLRVAKGAYARLRIVSWFDQESGLTNVLPVVEPRPPVLGSLCLGYVWRSRSEPPQACLTLNDFAWADRTEAAAWPGGSFAPFAAVEDAAPALYLGFDRPPPANVLGLLLDVDEQVGERGATLRWEAWDGTRWSAVAVEDETDGLVRPGIVRALWPGWPGPPAYPVAQAAGTLVRLLDPREARRFARGDELWLSGPEAGELVTIASAERGVLALTAPLEGAYAGATIGRPPLARFGMPRHWLRARLLAGAEPRRARVRLLRLNAAWAANVQTVENELLGSGTGEPDQVLFLQRSPVLAGEEIEVRELAGRRAHVEEPVLREELARQGIEGDAIRVVRDPRSGETREIWVRWRGRPNLFFSGPGDRDYVVDRARGRILCGGAGRGRPFPAGPDNVRARRYRSGGGTHGNVGEGVIDKVLSGAVAHEVANPLPARGGAAPEPVDAVLRRGPRLLRSRRQALTRADFEELAAEASPAVAIARAVAVADARGRFAPGRVRLAVVPFSDDEERPVPTSELRRRVREFVRARMPAVAAGGLEVVEPAYLPVGVAASVTPREGADPGAAQDACAAALRHLLHPLRGGPDGRGWAFGRPIHRSDVASALARVQEVERVERLALLRDGSPAGDRVDVPPDRLVAAGEIRVVLSAGEA